MSKFVSLTALAVASLAISTVAHAQTSQTTAPDADQAADSSSKSGDDIVVTAQRREQRLQDVPVVVTALSGEKLQAAGVRDIKDLAVLTPGLLVNSTSNEAVTTARIRGIGTPGENPGLEPAVGVVIDGVYRPRNGVAFTDLGEIDRMRY